MMQVSIRRKVRVGFDVEVVLLKGSSSSLMPRDTTKYGMKETQSPPLVKRRLAVSQTARKIAKTRIRWCTRSWSMAMNLFGKKKIKSLTADMRKKTKAICSTAYGGELMSKHIP